MGLLPHFSPSGCRPAFAASSEPLAKREDFRFLPVALLWAGCIRPGESFFGGSRTLGKLGKVWALCGGRQLPADTQETVRPSEFVRRSAVRCKRTPPLERTDPAEQEVWGRQREDPKTPTLSAFPSAPGASRARVGSKAVFLLRAVSRDVDSPQDVQSDPPPRNDFLEPFLWLRKGITHQHSCLPR